MGYYALIVDILCPDGWHIVPYYPIVSPQNSHNMSTIWDIFWGCHGIMSYNVNHGLFSWGVYSPDTHDLMFFLIQGWRYSIDLDFLLKCTLYHIVLYVSSVVSILFKATPDFIATVLLDPPERHKNAAFDDKGGLRHSQRRQSHRRV